MSALDAVGATEPALVSTAVSNPNTSTEMQTGRRDQPSQRHLLSSSLDQVQRRETEGRSFSQAQGYDVAVSHPGTADLSYVPQESLMRIENNRTVLEQSPKEMSLEIKRLFRQNPGCNPYRILAERNVSKQSSDSVHQRQHTIMQLSELTKTERQRQAEEKIREQARASSLDKLADTVNLNINLVVNQYGTVEPACSVSDIDAQGHVVSESNHSSQETLQPAPAAEQPGARGRLRKTGSKQGVGSKSQASKPINNQVRISRRQMLEPLKIANKLLALSKETKNMPAPTETFMTLAEKMGEQNVQIAQVRKFVDKQIEDDIQRETMKQGLNVLHHTLTKQGLTLKEVIERHTADLYERAEDQKLLQQGHGAGPQVKQQLAGKAPEKSRARFELLRSSQGFDFVRILEASSSMEPLISFQRKLMRRSKRKHQRMLAEQAATGSSIEPDNEYGLDASLAGQSARKQRKNRLFRDQDESIAHFIEYVKRLIFLNKQTEKMAQGIEVDMQGASDYDWVVEPEMYQSSSGESKYSNEDREEKDHLAVGEAAL